MVFEEMTESAPVKLVKILNQLSEKHNIALSFEGLSKKDLLEIYNRLHKSRVEIKESSSFNTYHDNETYITNGLVMEAINLFIEGVSLDIPFDSIIGD